MRDYASVVSQMKAQYEVQMFCGVYTGFLRGKGGVRRLTFLAPPQRAHELLRWLRFWDACVPLYLKYANSHKDVAAPVCYLPDYNHFMHLTPPAKVQTITGMWQFGACF